MTKYQVNLEATVGFCITVEADSPDDAVEAAFEQTPSLCAQCSGWGRNYELDLSEWDVPRNSDGSEAPYLVEEVES